MTGTLQELSASSSTAAAVCDSASLRRDRLLISEMMSKGSFESSVILSCVTGRLAVTDDDVEDEGGAEAAGQCRMLEAAR